MSVAGNVRWRKTRDNPRQRITDDARFKDCVLHEGRWLTSTVGPYVIQLEDGEGQVIGYGRSIKAATRSALDLMGCA